MYYIVRDGVAGKEADIQGKVYPLDACHQLCRNVSLIQMDTTTYISGKYEFNRLINVATHEIMIPKVMRDPSININAPRFAAEESSA